MRLIQVRGTGLAMNAAGRNFPSSPYALVLGREIESNEDF